MKSRFLIDDSEFTTEGVEGLQGSSFEVRSAMKTYSVELTTDASAAETVEEICRPGDFVVVDEKVDALHLSAFRQTDVKKILLCATEEKKTIFSSIGIIDELQKSGFTKANKLVVVGGGIVQDVAAFACGAYKRGIRWYYLPTTLLSMCDSCIGSKSSINHGGAKNQLGLFSAPDRIIINTKFLETLTESEIRSGLGEIVKLNAIGGEPLFRVIESLMDENGLMAAASLTDALVNSLLVKREVIEVDEFDRGVRRALNLGHTFGHAIESQVHYAIPHGQAIVVGMLIANAVARSMKDVDTQATHRLDQLLTRMLSIETRRQLASLSASSLMTAIRADKKTCGSSVNFVVIPEIGRTMIRSIPIDGALHRTAMSVLGSYGCAE